MGVLARGRPDGRARDAGELTVAREAHLVRRPAHLREHARVSPNLDGVRVKLGRARQHLEELRSVLAPTSNPSSFSLSRAPAEGNPLEDRIPRRRASRAYASGTVWPMDSGNDSRRPTDGIGEPSKLTAASTRPPAPTACTGIALSTTGADHVAARTIEWGHFDLDSKLIVSPRGHEYTSALPMGKHGLGWTGRYGFVGISVSQDQFIGEGMNEAGLNAGLFYFKGYGSLAPFDPEDVANRVVDMDLVRWILSQFASVDEVRAALPSITMAPIYIDDDGHPSPTAHWRVTDAAGGSIVIEIIDEGQVHVYDNRVGVVTNPPHFPWHVMNLDNYVNVRPGTVAQHQTGDLTVTSFGSGTAALGLPGDFSPPSRFVRAAFFRATTPPLATVDDAVSHAFHILHNFDIPIGVEFGDDERDHIPDLPSATQWTAASDLSNRRFFYTTMHDSAVKMVNLDRLDFDRPLETTHDLDQRRFTFRDVTPA